ncbi:MAG: hypothetical protein HIU57_09770 [Acidobacteria bacterium]|nr:hypothetical protein [Acidobacteriota bacterium]
MSRHHIPTRRVGRNVLILSAASLLFASCSSAAVGLSATGQPSLSLAAPLTTVACTTTGACIAVGASGTANAPTTAGQVRNRKGAWSALNVPPTPVAFFYDAACGANRCLVGGTRGGADLLWSVNTDNGAVTALAGPAGGLVIRNLACPSDTRCTLIDQGAHGLTRFLRTATAGATWSAPRTLSWAANRTTTLDCRAANVCEVATTSTTHHVTLRQTLNGGATWQLVTTPSTWTSIASLHCAVTCVALVSDATGWSVAHQVKATWASTPLSFSATSLSCATASTCFVVGHQPSGSAVMAQWRAGAVHDVVLAYVPTPLNHVACEPAVCVATGVTTVVALRP